MFDFLLAKKFICVFRLGMWRRWLGRAGIRWWHVFLGLMLMASMLVNWLFLWHIAVDTDWQVRAKIKQEQGQLQLKQREIDLKQQQLEHSQKAREQKGTQ